MLTLFPVLWGALSRDYCWSLALPIRLWSPSSFSSSFCKRLSSYWTGVTPNARSFASIMESYCVCPASWSIYRSLLSFSVPKSRPEWNRLSSLDWRSLSSIESIPILVFLWLVGSYGGWSADPWCSGSTIGWRVGKLPLSLWWENSLLLYLSCALSLFGSQRTLCCLDPAWERWSRCSRISCGDPDIAIIVFTWCLGILFASRSRMIALGSSPC